ncbi:MAG: AarF/ABC1/UbiB kinase family protein [Desulfobacterales bacterium]|nr:AarF/ABC1/UbiB kinase family protein [Desulfobacterales bacterium]
MRGIRRLGTITRVLARHGFADAASRLVRRKKTVPPEPGPAALPKESAATARRVRQALEELGPSFIKLGQLLSTRADLFPPAYIEEFKKLHDSVPPDPFEGIRSTVEKELKRPLSEIFASFSETSIAAASVAQVHRARLFTGEEVAVKVVRPGIAKKIKEDIQLMYFFARRIEKVFELGRVIGAVNLVQEFERTVFRELDMAVEAGNIEKFSHNFRLVNEIHIPKVYWKFNSKSVLVMEYVPGIKVDQVEEIQKQGIDPKAIALIGLRSLSRQLMEFGFFHADPHPGNTIVMYDGRVSLVDFGIVGYLDEEMMRNIANVFLGYAEHNYDMVMEAIGEAGLIDEETMDLKNFKTDLKDISEPFYGRSLLTISVRDVYDQVIGLVLKYNIRLPRNLLLLFKTLIQTEALGKVLGSDASILQAMRPYAKELIERSYHYEKIFENAGRDMVKASGYLRSAPKLLHDILRQIAAGKHRIEMKLSGLQRFDRLMETGVNRLTVGMVLSASIIAGSLVLNSRQKVIEFHVDLLGGQTFSLTSLLGVVGYSIATVLGVWLIVSIIRSGKL